MSSHELLTKLTKSCYCHSCVTSIARQFTNARVTKVRWWFPRELTKEATDTYHDKLPFPNKTLWHVSLSLDKSWRAVWQYWPQHLCYRHPCWHQGMREVPRCNPIRGTTGKSFFMNNDNTITFYISLHRQLPCTLHWSRITLILVQSSLPTVLGGRQYWEGRCWKGRL